MAQTTAKPLQEEGSPCANNAHTNMGPKKGPGKGRMCEIIKEGGTHLSPLREEEMNVGVDSREEMFLKRAPSEYMDRFVSREYTKNLAEALKLPVMENGSPARAIAIRDVLKTQCRHLRRAHELITQERAMQQIQMLARLRRERWKMFENVYMGSGKLALQDASMCRTLCCEGAGDVQLEVQNLCEDMKHLLLCTHHARDAFFDHTLCKAREIANGLEGTHGAQMQLQNFCSASWEYVRDVQDLQDEVYKCMGSGVQDGKWV